MSRDLKVNKWSAIYHRTKRLFAPRIPLNKPSDDGYPFFIISYGRYINLYYENLVKRSKNEILNIYTFLNESFEKVMIHPSSNLIKGDLVHKHHYRLLSPLQWTLYVNRGFFRA